MPRACPLDLASPWKVLQNMERLSFPIIQSIDDWISKIPPSCCIWYIRNTYYTHYARALWINKLQNSLDSDPSWWTRNMPHTPVTFWRWTLGVCCGHWTSDPWLGWRHSDHACGRQTVSWPCWEVELASWPKLLGRNRFSFAHGSITERERKRDLWRSQQKWNSCKL